MFFLLISILVVPTTITTTKNNIIQKREKMVLKSLSFFILSLSLFIDVHNIGIWIEFGCDVMLCSINRTWYDNLPYAIQYYIVFECFPFISFNFSIWVHGDVAFQTKTEILLPFFIDEERAFRSVVLYWWW